MYIIAFISLMAVYVCSIGMAYHLGKIVEIKSGIKQLKELRGEFQTLQKSMDPTNVQNKN